MQAAVIHQPVIENAMYGLQTSGSALRLSGRQELEPFRGGLVASFSQPQPQEDDLNNGDPPDLMLWGEE